MAVTVALMFVLFKHTPLFADTNYELLALATSVLAGTGLYEFLTRGVELALRHCRRTQARGGFRRRPRTWQRDSRGLAWRAPTGVSDGAPPPKKLTGHQGDVYAVALAPDGGCEGPLVATGRPGRVARLYQSGLASW
jgi:hypothetical protein